MAGPAETLSYSDPYRSATRFIDALRDPRGRKTLIRWRGDYYHWSGTCYRPIGGEELRSWLYRFLDGSLIAVKTGDNPPKWAKGRFVPDDAKVSKIMDAVRAQVLVSDRVEPRAWLGARSNGMRRPDAGDVVALSNGLLHLQSRTLLDHTPHFFNLNALDFDFDPNAPEPAEWLKFLASLWPSDPDSIATLQEIVGYMVSGRADLQKIFLVVGPKRSGKGTIIVVITALLGRENVTAPTLTSMRGEFGLEPLIGKTAAFLTDARLDLTTSQTVLVERLLRISGQDQIQINRKNRAEWNGRLDVRFFIASNEAPRLADASGAIASRFAPLKIRVSFYGHEDLALQGRLLAELPGIFNWALDGIDRLNTRGYFVIPQSAQSTAEQLADLASHVMRFGTECCDIDDTYRIDRDRLYLEWSDWAKDEQLQPGSKEEFGRKLQAAFPTVEDYRPRSLPEVKALRPRAFKGIRIRPGATGAERLAAKMKRAYCAAVPTGQGAVQALIC